MPATTPRAVLFDRDGTLVEDVPYNRDPDKVRPMPGAAELLHALRMRSVPCAVVSNQSGVGRGLITPEELAAVNDRVDELLGPFDAWEHCPHTPDDGCSCRKPSPTMVLRLCHRLGVEPSHTVVVGDIGADMEAAEAAGARGILVPTPRTLKAEIDAAQTVARSLDEVRELLGCLR